MTPWISIIIPIYNVEKYIENCLESIVADSREFLAGVEALVVDDGSPDRSGEIADSYAARYSFIRVIHKQNAGVAAARNTGMAAARGEWIYFMDSDDRLARGALGKIQARCAEHQDADILLFDAFQNHAERETAWEHFREESVWDTADAIAALQCGALYFPMAHPATKRPLAAPWDKVYRGRFLRENALRFAETLKVLDDMVFNMEAFGAARAVAYCKEKIYHYRYVPDSITNQYRPDRVEKDMAVWAYIRQYAARQNWDAARAERFRQAYDCRIIKSFSICCRLCFFHPQDRRPLSQKLRDVRRVLATEPYHTAFHQVRLRNAEWRLKIVTVIGRCRWAGGIWLLHVAQNFIR
ncbi:MAG: glycosyltransferase [Roseburia sp.]|nr:glycosyltransferase [Roseburia sp.]